VANDDRPAVTTATGTVTAVTPDAVTVTFDPASGCLSCATGLGCGLGPVLALFAPRVPRRVALPHQRGASVRVGDRVRIAIPAGRVAALAACAYGTPLLGILVGAMVAATLAPGAGDAAAAAGSLAGAALGWACLRCGGFDRAVAVALRSGLRAAA
jgi:positive regulator of sigma E activity